MTDRIHHGRTLRERLAARDADVPSRNQANDGDESRYADKRGTYTKGLQHYPVGTALPNYPGLVMQDSYKSFNDALLGGRPSDFERILVGSPGAGSKGRLNGPQGGLAYCLNGRDSSQFYSPPAPALDSMGYAVELIELYWASLIWGIPFANYGTDPTVALAANELTAHKNHYAGPKDAAGNITPQLLFRGPFPGEQDGPYLSLLLTLPATFGALTIDQKYFTLPPRGPGQPPLQYMTTPATYIAAQNGAVPMLTLAPTAQIIQDGAGLAAYTHDDVLYQAYLIANQVLATAGHPANPGIPYVTSVSQKAFATLGGPDAAALVGLVAAEALKAVWWQKWFVHLRHRPEAGGYLVHLQKTAGFDASTPDPVVAGSMAVARSAAANGGSFLLPQAFPEGSPTHPAYPTGHGAVAGACITVLKFFWDGNKPIPTMPANNRTLNGELHKLASNISFGHGIFAGIHWRSDTVESIKLGEAVALSILENRVQSYNESLSVTITRLDGTPYTITNR
jgi:hypothetical protein